MCANLRCTKVYKKQRANKIQNLREKAADKKENEEQVVHISLIQCCSKECKHIGNLIYRQVISQNTSTVDSFGATTDEQNNFNTAMTILKEYTQSLDGNDSYDKIEKSKLESLLAQYDKC